MIKIKFRYLIWAVITTMVGAFTLTQKWFSPKGQTVELIFIAGIMFIFLIAFAKENLKEEGIE